MAAAESQVRELQGQVLTLNQQLLGMTQQHHHYLQKIVALKSTLTLGTTPPSGAEGPTTLGGNIAANTSPVSQHHTGTTTYPSCRGAKEHGGPRVTCVHSGSHGHHNGTGWWRAHDLSEPGHHG